MRVAFNPRTSSIPTSFCVDGQWYDMLSDQMHELRDALGEGWTNRAVVALATERGWATRRIGNIVAITRSALDSIPDPFRH